MSLRIYNTLTRQKDEFKPLEPGKVSMYVCGPTVYDRAHIGHAMSSLVFDIVRRYLEFRGFTVRHVMNYTDVDDKIIIRANHEKRDPLELAEEYIDEYMQHIEDLNILPATVFPRATEEIDEILNMTARLVDDDMAYAAEGDVYYRVERKDDYGKLSGRKLEDMQAGARIDVDERKQHPMDFVLWKSAKPDEPSWKSPWGPGRPGWHIECSAMALHHLGQQIDIHGGGNDLVFPHHENEIAQTESITGQTFARYWMHNGMLQLSGEKMSKSIGNLITIEEFLEKNESAVIRMLVLNSNYRHPLTYNDKVVEQAAKGLERLRSALRPALPKAAGASQKTLSALQASLDTLEENFIAAMDDDFNSAAALAVLFDMVKRINAARDAAATTVELQPAQSKLEALAAVLGLKLEQATVAVDPQPYVHLFEQMNSQASVQISLENSEPPTIIAALLKLRDQFRSDKQWQQSDDIRDELASLGVLVEDSAKGSSWRWNN
jgi:cysteinyl-tRNA synthetase